MTTIHRVVIDPGFGGYKIAEITGDGPAEHVVPHAVARGKAKRILGASAVQGRGPNRPMEISFLNGGGETVECLVGPNVERHRTPITRTDFDMLNWNWEQRALTYGALYQLLGAGEHKVWLLVALPVQVLEGSDARKVVRRLRKQMQGVHEFKVRRSNLVVDIEQVLAAPQPMGAFFAWGLNDTGLWARDDRDLERLVGVVDVGFNTIDLLSLQGGAIVERYTGGNQLGMARPASQLASAIQREYGRLPSLHEVDGVVNAYLAGNTVEVTAGGEVHDVGAMVEEVLEQWSGEAVAYLSGVWGGDPGFAATLLTGGGASALYEQVRMQWGGVEILGDPVTANARGLARYAQRDAIWK